MNFVKSIDQFGAKFTHNVTNDDSQFKTVFGGIMTFLIYILSAAYSIYILNLWRIGSIPPTTNSNTQFITNLTYF